MPIYEYLCTSCSHRTDLVHGINDAGPAYCPSCGAEGTMRKQFAPPAIHYKGSGWAKKDRASSGSGTKAAGASTRKPVSSDAATAGSAATSDRGAATSDGGARTSDSGARTSDTSARSSATGASAGSGE